MLRDRTLDSNGQLMWALIVALTGAPGHIVYWYMRIWREQPAPAPPRWAPENPGYGWPAQPPPTG